MTGETPSAALRRRAAQLLRLSDRELAELMLKRPGQYAHDIRSFAGFIVNASPDKGRQP